MDPGSHPPVPRDLLEYLERQYPERSPLPTEKKAAMHHRGGKTALVRQLRAVFEEQNKTVLAPNS